MKAPPCPRCGKAVEGATARDAAGRGRFCSLACEIAFAKLTVEATCSVCGRRFLLPGGTAVPEPPFVCSGRCRTRRIAALGQGLAELRS